MLHLEFELKLFLTFLGFEGRHALQERRDADQARGLHGSPGETLNGNLLKGNLSRMRQLLRAQGRARQFVSGTNRSAVSFGAQRPSKHLVIRSV